MNKVPSTLKDLMDPTFQAKQARYENARIAVDKSYNISAQIASRNGVTDTANVVAFARALIPDILQDLNDTLKHLEDDNGTTTLPPKPS